MDKETVIRLAEQSGMVIDGEYAFTPSSVDMDVSLRQLAEFAALVAQQEREEAAKLCDEYAKRSDNSRNYADLCAAAIRARGES